ncbi:MAG: Rieske (2Fe-2S) protein [Deltaproteobacteria bacterium]|nr:MAG: Rieske (2Fe-2S) protein [Deltaproteobacteria bacterium]TMQ16345.1 MAG: Rieske (2Fe-2S) protein [Deltaproteobacteria bacterium]
MADEDRRRFLKVATCAIGGGVGLAVAGPVLTLLADPAGKTTVTTPTTPLDLGPAEQFRAGAEPHRVDVVAPIIKDGWTAARDVVLGAAWVRRTAPDKLVALSAVCPHLGCAIGWDAIAGNFLCPCHDSRFSVAGEKLNGPSERGMDELPLEVRDGRLLLTWVRYKTGQSRREPG